jgi:hypothetical protein
MQFGLLRVPYYKIPPNTKKNHPFCFTAMPSGVSLTGMAYMTNPYRQGGSKTLQFNATLFLNR